MDFLNYFDSSNLILLVVGLIILTASVSVFEMLHKTRLSLVLLFFAGIFICSFMAMLDPFLNSWDEQFHALVAKNLLSHPFIPTLYDKTPIPYDYTNWTSNHVWLHKQPLFLWQIAISLKLFGLNEFAVRVPSIIMMSIVPLFIYRIGKNCLNNQIGYYGALLFSTSFFVHDLVTGFPASDHNDIAFVFYVIGSIWCWTEYTQSNKKFWLVLIGIFSGGAVLVKWLTGLLVYSGWSLSILFNKEKRRSIQSYQDIFLSFVICLCVFLPWQVYITRMFPLESSYEYSLNSKHFTNVVELHSGDYWYYFNNLRKLYGEGDLVPYFVIFTLVIFFRSVKASVYRISFFTYVAIVYVFFSLAETKMISFCFIVSPIILLSIGNIIYHLKSYINSLVKKQKYANSIFIVLLCFILYGNLDLHQIAYKHTMFINPNDNDKRIEKINDAIFIKSLKGKLVSEDYIIFNCKPERDISIRFYTNYIAYRVPLSYENYLLLKKNRRQIATIDDGYLPDFLLNDSSIIKLKAPDKSWINNKD